MQISIVVSRVSMTPCQCLLLMYMISSTVPMTHVSVFHGDVHHDVVCGDAHRCPLSLFLWSLSPLYLSSVSHICLGLFLSLSENCTNKKDNYCNIWIPYDNLRKQNAYKSLSRSKDAIMQQLSFKNIGSKYWIYVTSWHSVDGLQYLILKVIWLLVSL